MELQGCKRCDQKEYIPTHQFLKIDDTVHYLCKGCWQTVRSWLLWEEDEVPLERQKKFCY